MYTLSVISSLLWSVYIDVYIVGDFRLAMEC